MSEKSETWGKPVPFLQELKTADRWPSTDWSGLSTRRRRVVRSMVLMLYGIPPAFAAVFILKAMSVANSSPVHLAVFLLLASYMLVSFGYYVVSFTRLAWWRCPSCDNRFFGTTLFFCWPFGDTCRHCGESRPADGF